ncbi:SprT family zinc-dependent metalloprotease [Alginatibacterium sediminis]|uniref:SprT family zinc-dependent metalloprotease n=1 Tax=Alginatibacterium sediminis TaxID=2164068 RepID=A0A420EDX6_9ALTE|nr:SprT family zinc-dependent metalloprotease [Alginatibacterium sediminis]RKF18870.1 SprT family zinc-dependent metalloprotease [Alginatibacterium sediminis]
MELENRLLERVEYCYQLAESYFSRSFERPETNFKQRGKIAGSAKLGVNVLRFNLTLYRENQDHFLEHTVPHEISHLLCFELFGRVPAHGQQWQSIMRDVFQLEPMRTHQYDVSSVQGKVFDYQCQCSSHQLTIRRHNKVLKGIEYRCRRCGSNLLAKS